MSRYKAYPEYKDSGKTWLGTVPLHWSISPLKYLAKFSGGGTPSKENEEFWSGDIPWVSPKDMKAARISSTIDNITAAAINQSSTSLLAEGALLMVVRSGILQHSIPVAINDVPVTLNQDMKALRFSEPHFVEYAFYLISGNQSQLLLEWYKEGATVESIEQEYLANSIFPCPPLEERKAIATFLDHETAKIDALINKQQQLIELLKEKRQAVISHAVTKGLNPNAPMKDSGVEWLGEVPAHWSLKNYRYATRIYRGKFGHRPRNDPALYDGIYPFIQTGDVAQAGKRILDYKQTLNERGAAVSQKFPAGTLVMAIAANIGDIAILDFEAYAPDSVVGFKPYQELNLDFLRYSLMAALPALEQTSTQSTQANLNIDRIGSVQAVFPPLDEQLEIVNYLDRLLERYADIQEKALIAIETIQERRTALISAAVTGKIDVRDWQAAAA